MLPISRTVEDTFSANNANPLGDTNGNPELKENNEFNNMEDVIAWEDLDLLDLDDDRTVINDENWLVPPESLDFNASSVFSIDALTENQTPSPKKQSLVSKLEDLKRGSPIRGGSISNSPVSAASYYRRISNGMSSTPLGKSGGNNTEGFDSRTFTRNKRSPLKMPSPSAEFGALNSTFTNTNSSVLNSTFTKLNQTFDLNVNGDCEGDAHGFEGLNTTFKKNERKLTLNSTFEVGKDDDISSSTSDGSVILNSVGDVKVIAKMQEDSLRNPIYSNRSATLSPTSENSNTNSPSQSEDQPQFQEYSSQDSLPDSPYSSQSLESQPLQNADRLGRSMPNLNKRGANNKQPGTTRVASASRGYGLSKYSTQHTSDSRLVGQREETTARKPPVLAPRFPSNPHQPRRTSMAYARPSGPTAPTSGGSRIARPPGTGIPRPGSRLPMFRGSTSRAPPNPGRNWRDECY